MKQSENGGLEICQGLSQSMQDVDWSVCAQRSYGTTLVIRAWVQRTFPVAGTKVNGHKIFMVPETTNFGSYIRNWPVIRFGSCIHRAQIDGGSVLCVSLFLVLNKAPLDIKYECWVWPFWTELTVCNSRFENFSVLGSIVLLQSTQVTYANQELF